jgi:lycopene beta-cyclase
VHDDDVPADAAEKIGKDLEVVFALGENQRYANDQPRTVGGYAGGWFHPTTGYSFPVALRLARHLASVDPRQAFGKPWDQLLAHRQSQAKYFNLLNRFLFGAIPPADRRSAFELFYRQPTETILRFYAMDLTLAALLPRKS